MNNYPEGADMGRVLDYPDYQPSDELGDKLEELGGLVEEALDKYPDEAHTIHEWEQEQRERLESADFWGNALTIDPLEECYEMGGGEN